MSDKIMIKQMIEIKGRKLIVDFIIFNIPDFDIILGINFFGRYRAKIDYIRNKAKFTLEDGDVFSFGEGHLCNMIISCVKARKMLHKGYTRFLAYVVSSVEMESPRLRDLLVV